MDADDQGDFYSKYKVFTKSPNLDASVEVMSLGILIVAATPNRTGYSKVA